MPKGNPGVPKPKKAIPKRAERFVKELEKHMSRKPGYKNPNAGRKKVPLVMSLPEKQIIFDMVLYWIDLQATQQEIAGSFHTTVDTLNERLIEHFGMNFSELKKRVEGESKISLRRYQFQMSEKNATMAIWLGKNWLGQKDNIGELKDLVMHELRAGIKQISEESRSEAASRSEMAPESPVSHSGSRRQLDSLPDEQGSTVSI